MQTAVQLIALLVAVPLLIAGSRALNRIRLSALARVGIGALLLIAGSALIYAQLQPGLNREPWLVGIAVALLGLGVNQMAAPLRGALGKAA